MPLPPNLPPGVVPFPPGVPGNTPFPPGFAPPANLASPDPSSTMGGPHIPSSSLPPPVFVPAHSAKSSLPALAEAASQQGRSNLPRSEEQRQPVLALPNPSLAQTNAEFKKPTELKVKDANFSPVSLHSIITFWNKDRYLVCRMNIGQFIQNISA